MIAKKCTQIMEDGFRCNRPFSDKTGAVRHKKCEEHRTIKDKKTGLIRSEANNRTGSPYLQAANAKVMEQWVITQMGDMPDLVAKIEELETKVSVIEGHNIPNIGSSEESKNRFLTGNRFKTSIDIQVRLAIMNAITEDETFNSKVMGTLAKLNGRMTGNITKMKDIEKSVSPRITELSEKLVRMERLMKTVEAQQIELAALLKKEKRNVKRRLEYNDEFVGVADLEEE